MDANSENASLAEINEVWDFVWKTFKNASLTYDLAFSQNATKTGQSEEGNIFDNPARLGIFTGLLIAWLADFRIGPIKDSRLLELKLKTALTWIFNITIFSVFAPFVTLFLSLCFVYRGIVREVLRRSEGNDFGGLLEGSDNVWAIEDDHAYSIINVLGILEMKMTTDASRILEDVRKLVQDRLIAKNFDKLCWQRHQRYGYFYWRRTNDTINLEDRVRWLGDDHPNCDGTCGNVYNGYLRKIMNRICNQPLPGHHRTNWEILVGRNCQRALHVPQNTLNVPLVFRIHHSVGDGVALLRVLLEAIADSHLNTLSQIKIIDTDPQMRGNRGAEDVDISHKQITGVDSPLEQIIQFSDHLLDASMPFAVRTLPPVIVKFRSSVLLVLEKVMRVFMGIRDSCLRGCQEGLGVIRRFGRNMIVLISIPSCLVGQALHCLDNSALHGTPLTGEKIISCWMEGDFINDRDSGLLEKIRDIKNSTGTRFGDVVLAALSANLHRYFETVKETAPKTVTVVIPARMSAPRKQLSLRNGFSVGLLPLCISQANGKELTPITEENTELKYHRLLERLRDVSRCSENLRQSPDYIINYWVMDWLAAALPKKLLEPFLKSHSTMVFSNLPGPNKVDILGNSLEKVAFWIPHRGTTGIGVSFLTYGGRAHMSVIVDKGILRDESILDTIVRDTVDDIKNLHEYITVKLTHLRKQGLVCSNE
uniref:Il4 protein n=1 Tax=Fopius arisanus TaxID=64838 RepID=A0A0C9QKA0_9HYME